MVAREQYPGGMQALANALSRLREEVAGLRETGFRVPVLSADPPAGDPTNMWMFPDGRLRVRLPNGTVQQLTTAAGGGTTSTVAKPADPLPVTYSTEWSAQWDRTYDASGALVTGLPSGVFVYGKAPSDPNQRRTMIGFDAAAIRTAITGARIVSIDLRLQNLETVAPDGVTLSFGGHNNLSAPSTYVNTTMLGTTVRRFAPQDNKWVGLDPAFATALQTDTIDGLVIDQQTDDPTYAGRGAAVGGGFVPPQLRIVYVK